MRPVVRSDRGPYGQRHLDGRDHPRRNPAARTQHRREPAATASASDRERDHQRRRRDRPRGGLQRAGPAGAGSRPASSSPAASILLEEHVARRRERGHRRLLRETVCDDQVVAAGYRVYEIPMEVGMPETGRRPAARQEHVRPRHALQSLQPRPASSPAEQVALHLRKKGELAVTAEPATCWKRDGSGRRRNLATGSRFPPSRPSEPQIVVNGNTALGLGVMASGMEVCSMYPITPATSASHYLSDVFENGRRCRAPGRGRDRRLRLRHRRLLRGQVRGHHHLRPRILAEAGDASASP